MIILALVSSLLLVVVVVLWATSLVTTYTALFLLAIAVVQLALEFFHLRSLSIKGEAKHVSDVKALLQESGRRIIKSREIRDAMLRPFLLAVAVLVLWATGLVSRPAALLFFALAATQAVLEFFQLRRLPISKEAQQGFSVAVRLQESLRSFTKNEEVCGEIIRFFCAEFGISRVAMFAVERVGRRDVLVAVSATGFEIEKMRPFVYELDGTSDVSSRAMAERTPIVVSHAPADWRCDQNLVSTFGLTSVIALPMFSGDRPVSLLLLDAGGQLKKLTGRLKALDQAARAAGLALENTMLYERVQQLAIMDGLTEVYNHRHFQETLRQEIDRANRYPKPIMHCSLVLLDVDQFKQVNDTYGHQAGDAVLIQMAQILKRNVRKVDTVARYGGDELVLVLPSTHKAGAFLLAERLRQNISETLFEIGPDRPSIHLTVSVGVATYAEDGTAHQEIVSAADSGLYQAKRDGRNCVRCVRPPQVETTV